MNTQAITILMYAQGFVALVGIAGALGALARYLTWDRNNESLIVITGYFIAEKLLAHQRLLLEDIEVIYKEVAKKYSKAGDATLLRQEARGILEKAYGLLSYRFSDRQVEWEPYVKHAWQTIPAGNDDVGEHSCLLEIRIFSLIGLFVLLVAALIPKLLVISWILTVISFLVLLLLSFISIMTGYTGAVEFFMLKRGLKETKAGWSKLR